MKNKHLSDEQLNFLIEMLDECIGNEAVIAEVAWQMTRSKAVIQHLIREGRNALLSLGQDMGYTLDSMPCVVCDVLMDTDTHKEEMGMCVACSNNFYDGVAYLRGEA